MIGPRPTAWVCPRCGERYGETAARCAHDGADLVAARGLIGQTVGSHVVVGVLGAGGMGTVYQAIQPEIGALVAIKVMRQIPDERDRTAASRFFAEARTAGQLRHENIVKVLDFSHLEDGRPYLVMEHLDGAPLSEIIRLSAPLPIGTTARLMEQVLAALGAAHQRGVIHRDLKPGNLFVTRGGRPVVLDFGIAKLRDGSGGARLTLTGAPVGTPAYMAPEQVRGGDLDRRADLYAAGVVLYEALTGSRPFHAESEFEVMAMQVDQAPASPRFLRPDLPAAVEEIILTALAKTPERRHGSAEEMADALREACASLPAECWAELSIPSWPLPEAAPDEPLPGDPPAQVAGRLGWTAETAPAGPREQARQATNMAAAGAPEAAAQPAPPGTRRGRRGRWLAASAALLALGAALGVFLSGGLVGSSNPPGLDAGTGSAPPSVSRSLAPSADLDAPIDAGQLPAGAQDGAPPAASHASARKARQGGRPPAAKPALPHDPALPPHGDGRAATGAARPGSEDALPSPRTLPGPASSGRFRPERFVSEAARLAQESFPDAELVWAIFSGVRRDGTMDLTQRFLWMDDHIAREPGASYVFNSVSRGARLTVKVDGNRILIRADRGALPLTPIRPPRCSLTALWDRLNRAGQQPTQGGNAYEFQYRDHRWLVGFDPHADAIKLPDGCD